MGSGKTFYARILSRRYCLKMIDVDAEIEAFCQESIQNIFFRNGEKYFRQIESMVFARLLRGKTGLVIASGGGLPFQNVNKKLLERQTVVYLNFPFSRIWQQLKNSRSRRPLLRKLDRGMIKSLWQQRRPGYHKTSDYVITSEEKLLQLLEWLTNKGKKEIR